MRRDRRGVIVQSTAPATSSAPYQAQGEIRVIAGDFTRGSRVPPKRDKDAAMRYAALILALLLAACGRPSFT